MRQLQIFTPEKLSEMRDRTKSRNYSPLREEFRLEQERRRACHKAHLHALREHRLREQAGGFLPSDAAPPLLYESADERRRGQAPEPQPPTAAPGPELPAAKSSGPPNAKPAGRPATARKRKRKR
jgi:hypothetical protein